MIISGYKSYYPFQIVLPLGRFAVNKWNGTCHLTTGKNGYIYFLQISTYTVEIDCTEGHNNT